MTQTTILKRIHCFITGGHKVSDGFIYSWVSNGKPDHFKFKCIECGKVVQR